MPKAYVLSHGCRVDAWPDTFVPAGKTVHYYADFDENTLRVNGLAVLSAGDITPTESFAGGATISDYLLSKFTDAELAQHFASESSATGGPLLTIGGDLPDNLPLCTDPNNCVPPQHQDTCTGLLRRVVQDEIHLVACRGLAGAANSDLGWKLGTDAAHNPEAGEDRVGDSYVMELNRHAQELLDFARTDPQGALDQFRGYPQGTQAALIGAHSGLSTWLESAWGTAGTAATATAAGGDGLWLPADLRAGLLGNGRPKKFESAFKDDYWRNVFWIWFTGVAHATGQQEALLTLLGHMNDYYDNRSVDTARVVLDFAEGGRGVQPACDAGQVQSLRAAVDADSRVRNAMDELWDGVVAQLEMVYPGFYEDAGTLKDAIR